MAVSNMSSIHALVTQLREAQALVCDGGGDSVQTKTIISQNFGFGDIIISGRSTKKRLQIIVSLKVWQHFIYRPEYPSLFPQL